MFVLVSVQVHPGMDEVAIAGLVYVAVFAVLVLTVPNRAIARSLWWTIPGIIVVAAVGAWNPWRLAAVNVAFDHPYLAVVFAATLLTIACFDVTGRSPTDRWRWVAVVMAVALPCVVGAALLAAALGMADVPGSPLADAGASGPGLRYDRHEELSMCRPSTMVVRVGEGLGMRERELDHCRTWQQIDGRLVSRVCRPDEPYVDRVLTFDPETLDVLEEQTFTIVEPPLEPNSARRECGPPAR